PRASSAIDRTCRSPRFAADDSARRILGMRAAKPGRRMLQGRIFVALSGSCGGFTSIQLSGDDIRENCRDITTDAAAGRQCAQIRPAAIDQAIERIYLTRGANNLVVSATYTGITTVWIPRL